MRLLLPFVVGIYAGLEHATFVPCSIRVLGMLCLALLALVVLAYVLRNKLPAAFGIGLNLFLLVVGYTLGAQPMRSASFPPSGKPGVYVFKVLQQPEEKPRTILCKAVACHAADSLPVQGRQFLLYMAKDSLAETILPGDTLMVQTTLAPPRNNGIPYEFDYARYLRLKGVAGTAYVAEGQWRVAGHDDSALSLDQRMAQWRGAVLELYERLGFQDGNLAVLSALTLGEKDGLDSELRQAYTVAGVSHVLALSGLHIGLLYGCLLWTFGLLWRRLPRLKPVLLAVALLVLWGYAAVTGFSPSVVRAVIMFSLLAVANLLPERPLSLNTLSVAAFLMLLVHPQWLLDVGFQLSFASMYSILLLQPRLWALIPEPHHWALRRVWGLLTVSVAAQLGAAPLVLFYFNHFSTHFLLSNLCVLPLVTLVMHLALVMLLCSPFGTLQSVVAYALRWLIDLQNTVLDHLSRLPFALLDNLYIDVLEIVLFYLFLALLLHFVRKQVAGRLLLLLAVVLLGVTYHGWQGLRHAPSMSINFYNVSGTPAAHCISPAGQSWLFCPQGTDVAYLQRAIRPLCLRMGMAPPTVVQTDATLPNAQFVGDVLSFGSRRVCFVHNDVWRSSPSADRLAVDVAYVSRGYRGTLKQLLLWLDIGTVVLDASVSDFYANRLARECRENQVPLVRLDQVGTYSLAF